MSQRWPLLHRRASMTALRYSGLRLSAGKVDGSAVETIMSVSTMPCRVPSVPASGTKGCGFRPFLGLYYSLSRRHLRQAWTPSCHSIVTPGKSPLLYFQFISRCHKAGGSRSGKHRPFYFHAWPSIHSRGLSSSGCVAPSHDEASLDGVTLSYNYTEEIVKITAPDKVEYRRSVSESTWEEARVLVDPTIIVFDIETTGFLRSGSKIVELACRDLAGGDRSTLETLVNPYQPVPLASTAVHKITSEMVNRDDIPSWTEVMTAFVDFVESRRKGNSDVILVAHNGRRFDVPFIMKECHECSMAIPPHWYFVDTIDLAKTMLKKRFGKTKLYNLQYLYYDCYNLPRLEDAHRAGVDVDMLACVFGKLLMDLEMPVSELLDQAFKASDVELKPDLLIRDNGDRYGRSGFGMPQLESTT